MLSKLFARSTAGYSQLSMKHWLLFSVGFSGLLLCARMAVTGERTYVFLVWNLFLAFVPYFISEQLSNRPKYIKNKALLVSVLITWLLFIPNSFYILTDLFHLHEFDSAPKWFDLLLIFSFAWNGLLLGILSVRTIEGILANAIGRGSSLVLVFAVMWLNAFGVYIGRYLRYNSWDVVTQPFTLFTELTEILLHPFRNKMEWSMITVYAVFMTIIYMSVRKAGDATATTDQTKNQLT